MNRGKNILIVSHCLLNSNSKIESLSQYPGVFKEFMQIVIDNDIGLIQLPCPEILTYGMRRWGHVKEQFDNLHYRKKCRILLNDIIEQIYSYKDTGYNIIGIVGVDGSPSCGVSYTCSSKEWSGSIEDYKNIDDIKNSVKMINEKGVFMEEFSNLLQEELNLDIPFIGIDEENVYNSINEVRKFILNKI